MTPIANPALIPPGGIPPAGPAPPRPSAGQPAPGARAARGANQHSPGLPAPSFADALDRAGAALQFSKHAIARVQRRGIELDAGTLGRLAAGVEQAAGKGSRDSLVLVDNTAFVVSVANRTVITAVGAQQMKDNVFTNIDSAVIA